MFEAKQISIEEIVPTAQEMFNTGWRFVTQSVVDLGEGKFDLIYHYDHALEMKHFRVTMDQGTKVPSMSSVYFAALLVENENRDLFGVAYEGLVLDFNRTLYLDQAGDPMTAPFCKISTFTKPKCEV